MCCQYHNTAVHVTLPLHCQSLAAVIECAQAYEQQNKTVLTLGVFKFPQEDPDIVMLMAPCLI